jgi:hypothetical protein
VGSSPKRTVRLTGTSSQKLALRLCTFNKYQAWSGLSIGLESPSRPPRSGNRHNAQTRNPRSKILSYTPISNLTRIFHPRKVMIAPEIGVQIPFPRHILSCEASWRLAHARRWRQDLAQPSHAANSPMIAANAGMIATYLHQTHSSTFTSHESLTKLRQIVRQRR